MTSLSTKDIEVRLPDGSTKTVEFGTTPMDIAMLISPGLAKASLAARVDGELYDINRPFSGDASLELITSKNEADALELVRHDFAHVLAEAVQALFPGTQITFGPINADGFYYDFAPAPGRGAFTEDELPKIEAKMREIIAADKPLTRESWTRDDLIKWFDDKGESFKSEWAKELPDDEELTIYRSGDDWLDMCRGPHLASTGKLDPQAFKLTKVSGAYWRGDQNNAMLSRVYGTGWLNKKQLNAYLLRVEEAEKRDHRKLGQEMDLFHFQSEAQGSCFWHRNGFIIYRELEAYMRRQLDAADYDEIKTPQLMDAKQWEKSGHWGKYRENMFVVPDQVPGTDEDAPLVTSDGDMMALKPMNCPAHVMVFNQGNKSYRDLPIRMAEFGCCHRNEPHGALHGLMRVRQFTQDDAHIFCREDQLIDEIAAFCDLLDEVYNDFDFGNYQIKLALRPDQRFGSDEDWDKSEQILRDAVKKTGRDTEAFGWEELENEGAFYAPKLEFHLTDAIGRSWQVGTIQADTVLPERLDAFFINSDGERERPVMLHRAIFGTFERFIGILIEHYAGKFPLWMAPIQVVVATVVSDANEYAEKIVAQMQAAGIRAELDSRNETINYKVREHSTKKTPYIFAVGRREAEADTVSVRKLGDKRQSVISIDEAVEMLCAEGLAPDMKRRQS